MWPRTRGAAGWRDNRHLSILSVPPKPWTELPWRIVFMCPASLHPLSVDTSAMERSFSCVQHLSTSFLQSLQPHGHMRGHMRARRSTSAKNAVDAGSYISKRGGGGGTLDLSSILPPPPPSNPSKPGHMRGQTPGHISGHMRGHIMDTCADASWTHARALSYARFSRTPQARPAAAAFGSRLCGRCCRSAEELLIASLRQARACLWPCLPRNRGDPDDALGLARPARRNSAYLHGACGAPAALDPMRCRKHARLAGLSPSSCAA